MPSLQKYVWLSIGTAVATVGLKSTAAYLTGSVGLLSDALESLVNLVAAIVAFFMLRLAFKPADGNHDFGHGKAEYFSSAFEGALIFIAAGAIISSAIERFFHPQELESFSVGLVLSAIATILNGIVGWILISAGREHHSILLEADGKHLNALLPLRQDNLG